MTEIKNQTLYDEHGLEVQLYTLRDMWKQEGWEGDEFNNKE
jgi:hypothetical protein